MAIEAEVTEVNPVETFDCERETPVLVEVEVFKEDETTQADDGMPLLVALIKA